MHDLRIRLEAADCEGRYAFQICGGRRPPHSLARSRSPHNAMHLPSYTDIADCTCTSHQFIMLTYSCCHYHYSLLFIMHAHITCQCRPSCPMHSSMQCVLTAPPALLCYTPYCMSSCTCDYIYIWCLLILCVSLQYCACKMCNSMTAKLLSLCSPPIGYSLSTLS